MQIGNGRSDNGAVPKDGQRYSIHDVLFEDVNGAAYEGTGYLAILGMSPVGAVPILQHVKIDHITAFPSRGLLNVGGPLIRKMADFTFTNSILSAGNGLLALSSTGGGLQNCSARVDAAEALLNRCFSPYTFERNAIVGSRQGGWPRSNFLLGDPRAVQFTNYNGGNGGDYRLLPTSRYKRAASDGTDLGVNLDVMEAHIAGVTGNSGAK
jgi:hypothetical protein